MSEEIDNIKKRVVRHPDAVDLYIKRLPKETRDLFVDFANEEFVGDYGMTLKYILHEFLIQSPRLEMILTILDDHEAKIAELSNKEPKSIKTDSAKGIRNHLKKRKEALKEAKEALKAKEEKKNVKT